MMKILFSIALMGLMLLAFSGSDQPVTVKAQSTSLSCSQVYNDTVPRRDSISRKDSLRKDRRNKREKRDSLQVF